MEASTQDPDRRWMILAGFAVVAASSSRAILIGRSGGDDEDSKTAGAEGCKQVAEPKPKQVSFAGAEADGEEGRRS